MTSESAQPVSSSRSGSVSKYNNENAIEAKIVLLGDSGAGKTSLVHRYVSGQFSEAEISTVGASFWTKRVIMEESKLKLQIWDTAGQERFRSMTPMYYRNADAAILVYQITDNDSFEAIQHWVEELHESSGTDNIVISIVGNKTDLEEARVVKRETAEAYAQEIGALFKETSAKLENGLESVLLQVSERLVEIALEATAPKDNTPGSARKRRKQTKKERKEAKRRGQEENETVILTPPPKVPEKKCCSNR